MNDTPNLALPYILAAQAQKHVTHNEALRAIDCLVQLSVVSRILSAPPSSPGNGSRYIVAAAATGAWMGYDGQVAAYQDGAWALYVPKDGWCAWCESEAILLVYQAGAWSELSSSGELPDAFDNLTRVGINATADTTNRLSLKSPASLFDNVGAGHQQKINKAAAGDTASVLYQTNYSGRAEMGLAGDDDFHFKVSPNGSTWYEALKIDRNTGRVSFPIMGGPREALTANRTYYVRTDGNDANTGLANTSGGAFATIQKAMDVAAALDLGIYSATIQLGNTGTYVGCVLKGAIGSGRIIINGDQNNPSNYVITKIASGNPMFSGNTAQGLFQISGVRLHDSTCANAITSGLFGNVIYLINNDYGDVSSYPVYATAGGQIQMSGVNNKISGTAWTAFIYVLRGAYITVASGTKFTWLANTTIATGFVLCQRLSILTATGVVFDLGAFTVTGRRYYADVNSIIDTASGGANYFPGTTAGSSSGATYL